MEEEILKKKADWVISQKLKIEDSDKIKESSIEFFPDRYLVMAVLESGSVRKVVTKDQGLAYAILGELSKK